MMYIADLPICSVIALHSGDNDEREFEEADQSDELLNEFRRANFRVRQLLNSPNKTGCTQLFNAHIYLLRILIETH